MNDELEEHPGKEGLPGQVADDGEEQQPTEPTRRSAGETEGGDSDAGGESGEGSQSTGNPDSAG